MKKLENQSKKIAYFTLLLAILFSYLAISNVRNVNINIIGWEGFHILLVENSVDDTIYTKLQASGFFDEIISKYNTKVAYSDYNTLSYTTVDKIEQRFNPLDPRFDNFMRNIPRYFQGYIYNKPASVYYLRTEAGYSQTSAVINSILGNNYNWVIPKYENHQLNYVLLFLYILILLVFIYNSKKQWFLYLLYAIPWAFLVHLNGKIYFFPAIVMLFILMLFLFIEKEVVKEYINNKAVSLKKYLHIKAVLIAVITIFSFILPKIIFWGSPDSYIAPIFILLYGLCFITSRLFFTYHRVTGYSHKIFYATQIRKEEKLTILSLNVKSFILIYFLLAAALPFYLFNTGSKNLKYPVPVATHKYPESGLTLEFLGKVSAKNAKNNYLPGYCEYIKHLAYQIRLPFRIDFSMPFNNEEITISHYYFEKNNYNREKIVVNRFTDVWLNDNLRTSIGGGITRLMVSGSGLIQAESGTVVLDVPLFIIPLIFVILYPILFYYLFFKELYNVIKGLKKSQIYGTKKKIIPLIKRRKQQAA
ncbi:MAG: hypothetical protein FWD87_04540 [Spirochaetaceae bacterium]|nr:hypothetical protein [Spirochaetaceae bacterium]